jgi:myo-inositol-hexaphosphate 3-phosphohydrolase
MPRVRFSDQGLELDAVDQVDGVEHVALGLGHLLPFGIAHQAVDVDSRNGTSSMNLSPIMIIRATQKKMMSKPVTSTLVG